MTNSTYTLIPEIIVRDRPFTVWSAGRSVLEVRTSFPRTTEPVAGDVFETVHNRCVLVGPRVSPDSADVATTVDHVVEYVTPAGWGGFYEDADGLPLAAVHAAAVESYAAIR